MAIVPVPNRPTVRRAPNNNVSMSPSGAIRANQAVASAINAGLGGLIDAKIESRNQQIAAEEEAYKSQLNIISDRLSTNEKLAINTFKESTDQAKPEDVQPIWDGISKRLREDFEAEVGGLRPADRKAFEEEFSNNLLIQIQAAEFKRKKRIFEVEVAGAKRTIETRALEENRDADREVRKATEIMKRHFPADWQGRIDDLMQTAHYNQIISIARQAETPDEIDETWRLMKYRAPMLDPGHEYNIGNQLRAAEDRWIRETTTLDVSTSRAASRGDELDIEALDQAVELGKMTEERKNELITQAKDVSNHKLEEEIFNNWKSTEWRPLYTAIESEFAKMKTENPRITRESWQKVEALIEGQATNSRERAHAKAQALGLYLQAVGRSEDKGWLNWSDYSGDKIEALPESVRDAAREDMVEIVSQLQKFATDTKADFYMNEMTTAVEDLVFTAYDKGPVTSQTIAEITDKAIDIGALGVVRDTLSASPTGGPQEGTTATNTAGEKLIFRGGEWVPLDG